MANTDSAANNVRFNLDGQQLEFASATDWIAVPITASGISSGNAAAGTVLTADGMAGTAWVAASGLTTTSANGQVVAGAWTSGEYLDCASITLTTGTWMVAVTGVYTMDTGTPTLVAIGLSNTPGNSSTGLVQGDSLISLASAGFADSVSATIANYLVTVTGASEDWKFKSRIDIASGNKPQLDGRITALKIA